MPFDENTVETTHTVVRLVLCHIGKIVYEKNENNDLVYWWKIPLFDTVIKQYYNVLAKIIDDERNGQRPFGILNLHRNNLFFITV